MEETFPFHFPASSALLSLVGTVFFFVDVVLDVWAVVSLYQEGEYVYMGLLIALLIISSVLVQIFSWIWYTEFDTTVDKFAHEHGLIGPLHILQLGIFLRFASLIEITIRKIKESNNFMDAVAVFLKHDLSMLRLFETFSESVPQLILMITIVMQEQEIQLFTGFKIFGSFMSITTGMLFYHRDMRQFVSKDQKMGWASSTVYFLWNLLLIIPRVFAVALLASAEPCYLAAHFLCLWMLLVLWALWQKTDFMDTEAGEWLYRATLGLVWYFSWFNVDSGKTKVRSIVYQMWAGADTALLLGLWFWRRSVESARLPPLPINPYVLIGALAVFYITGLLIKLLYFWKVHPSRASLTFKVKPKITEPVLPRVAARAINLDDIMMCRVAASAIDPEEHVMPRVAARAINRDDIMMCRVAASAIDPEEHVMRRVAARAIDPEELVLYGAASSTIDVDEIVTDSIESISPEPEPIVFTGTNKRMRHMAANFYK